MSEEIFVIVFTAENLIPESRYEISLPFHLEEVSTQEAVSFMNLIENLYKGYCKTKIKSFIKIK